MRNTSQQSKKNSPYSASMTGCGFVLHEFSNVVPLMLDPNAEQLIREEVSNNHLLMMNSELTRRRAMTELQKRFNAVPRDFWEYYLQLNDDDRPIAMLYPIMQAYAIVNSRSAVAAPSNCIIINQFRSLFSHKHSIALPG